MDFTNSAAPAQQSAPADGANQIASLPPIQALLAGKPAAIYADDKTPSPLASTISQNLKSIGALGLALYHSPSQKFILFNPAILSPANLKKADEAGKLDSVAAPLNQFESAGATQTPQPDAGAASPDVQPPVAQPLTKGLTPRAQSKLAGTRIKSLLDNEEPTSQPVPGGGKILNSLFARAV